MPPPPPENRVPGLGLPCLCGGHSLPNYPSVGKERSSEEPGRGDVLQVCQPSKHLGVDFHFENQLTNPRIPPAHPQPQHSPQNSAPCFQPSRVTKSKNCLRGRRCSPTSFLGGVGPWGAGPPAASSDTEWKPSRGCLQIKGNMLHRKVQKYDSQGPTWRHMNFK